MFEKIKSLLKDYFIVEHPGDDYGYYPNEYGSYPFYKLSGTSDDLLDDEMDKEGLK
ncbi:hypothetical protein [Paenibacillus radicis (ex Xue et al. 2023)]|uniref:Uncharacterized protein n=1 Tax=Paenibacillus radicis (ex Xue et al. 2023) TaxID=2972489 RepID=A0ABT1YPJ7_9BACL|nr:hypothetical protein [Paenibacillus radicis (ex Xue et al. 2023)]MCR8635107.1 hypothetical protein [Paenibacillus radicis (ex Xue et al. 2023)]